jgi:hypothetical protein
MSEQVDLFVVQRYLGEWRAEPSPYTRSPFVGEAEAKYIRGRLDTEGAITRIVRIVGEVVSDE